MRWNLDERQLVVATTQTVQQLENALRAAVLRAREAGLSWEDVASALGTAKQSAWRKFREDGMAVEMQATLRVCSFCGEPQNRVKHLVAAPTGASICGECLDLAARMLKTARAPKK